MSRLADDQLCDFDVEYVTDARWPPIRAGLERLPADFRFLDVGGGNGLFADRVLDRFPQSTGVVGDNAELLLERNMPHDRKRTVFLDALALPGAGLERVDVVFLHWVLHHLVVTGEYGRSRENAVRVLSDVRGLLEPDGVVSVYENMYDGWLYHNAPGHLVFHATSITHGAGVVRRLGANTAGVGVCFQSEASWRTIFAKAGFEVASFTPDEPWELRRAWRFALLVKSVRCGHFWLRPTSLSARANPRP